MKYQLLMSIDVVARDDREAHEYATKLRELLKSPMLRIAVEGAGIQVLQGGNPTVYQPQRA